MLAATGSRVDVVANVMPRIGTLEVEPARQAISDAFVNHVIKGKGLSASDEFASQVVGYLRPASWIPTTRPLNRRSPGSR